MSDEGGDIDWTGTPDEVVREILSQGQMYLQAQLDSALAADQRSTTLASILTTVAVAVIAGAIALWEDITADVFVGGLTMALFLLAAATSAAWAARPIAFFMPGSRPSDWYDARTGKLNELLGGAAENVQFSIDENEAFMSANERYLRAAFILALLSPIFGLVAWWLVSLYCPA